MAYIALSPRGWRPRASVQYIPYIPRARVITITYIPLLRCCQVQYEAYCTAESHIALTAKSYCTDRKTPLWQLDRQLN